MYIIACIKENIVYWSSNKLYTSLIIAKSKLSYLQAEGHTDIDIYEVMDLKKVDI